MDQNTDIRRFTKSSIQEVQKLSETVFGKKIPTKYYLTLFGDSDPYLGYIAFDKGKAVAFFGAIEVLMTDGRSQFKAAQPVNIMIHPDYKNNNYFLILYNKVLELAKESGIKLFFGWPNSELIFSRILRWEKICPMYKLVIPVKTIPLGKILYKLKILLPVYNKFISRRIKEYEIAYNGDVQASLTPKGYPHIERSENYLNQKQTLGAKIISMDGMNIIINNDYRLKIGDTDICSIEQFNRIITILKRICLVTGLSEIVCYLNPSIQFHKQIIEYYQCKEDIVLMYKKIDPQIPDNPLLTFTDFDTF